MKTFLILCLFASFAFGLDLDYYQDQYRVYTHEVDIHAVYLPDSRWTPSIIKEHFEEAAHIYAQCGVKLNPRAIVMEGLGAGLPGSGEIYFDLEGYVVADAKRPESSALELAKRHQKAGTVTAIFFDVFDMFARSVSATAMPQVRVTQDDQADALHSVWLSSQVEYDRGFTPEEGGYPRGYSVLAHELGHVLLNDGHVEDHRVHNLMSASMYNLNGRLSVDQCQRIRSSELARELPPEASACREVASPMRADLSFQFGEIDCASAQTVVKKLEAFHDELSDLNPVSGVDFYFSQQSDLIQYQDKNIFEGSFQITYDPWGRRPLREEQSDALWLHELGHAIFNAQLVSDWPWFAGRMENFREWNERIRAEDSEGIYAALEKIADYPDSDWLDDLIAPYHELFADLAVMIHYDDPQAISKALAPPEGMDKVELQDYELQAIVERDFSVDRNWEDWKEEEVHSMLAPAGSAIWKRLEELKKRLGKKELLRFVYGKLYAEMRERASDLELRHISVEQMNRRLIEKLAP